jgi:hypothetical protein
VGRTKVVWTEETLATRTCKNGHTGNFALRKNTSPACRDCLAVAVKKHREMNPHQAVGKMPKAGQLQKLEQHILDLEKALEIAKQRLAITLELKELHEKLNQIK